MIEEENIRTVHGLIANVLNEKSPLERTKMLHVLLTTLADKSAQRTRKWLLDTNLQRRIALREAILDNNETKIDYYDDNIGDKLDHQEDLEINLAEHDVWMLETLAQIIAELQEDEIEL